jgi:hypothetical protein
VEEEAIQPRSSSVVTRATCTPPVPDWCAPGASTSAMAADWVDRPPAQRSVAVARAAATQWARALNGIRLLCTELLCTELLCTELLCTELFCTDECEGGEPVPWTSPPTYPRLYVS